MQDRFKLDISRKSFYCYDCSQDVAMGAQFSWDNFRKTRICLLCLDRLKDIVGSSDDSESDSPTKKKVYWDMKMLPTRPWQIGNYDINSWPPSIQREYAALNSGPSAYEQGLKAARNRLGYGSSECPECLEEDKTKRVWTEKEGIIDDWIEQIHAQTDIEACKALWLVISGVKWPQQEMMRIGKIYSLHLANLVSIDTWGKPFRGIKALEMIS